jgi:hypothetical protein
LTVETGRSMALTMWNVAAGHPVVLAVTATMAIYFVAAYASISSYSPDPSKPSGGIRVRLNERDMAPMEKSNFVATIRHKVGIFENHADLDATDTSSPIEVWEDGKKLGPAHSTIIDIQQFGQGRFRFERGSGFSGQLTWSSSDNTDPMTNGRTYWVVNPAR